MVTHFIYVLIDLLLLINKASNIGIIQQIICIVSQNKRAIIFFGEGSQIYLKSASTNMQPSFQHQKFTIHPPPIHLNPLKRLKLY